MSFKLYHHPVSTCSQKVRLALAEKAIDFDEYVIDWTTMEHLQDWYLALNPNGVVPTLVNNGVAIVDSSVICEYLEEIHPAPSLSPSDPIGRARMRAWMRYFEEVPTSAIRVPSFNALFVKAIKGQRSRAEYEQMTAKMPLRRHFYRQMKDDGFAKPAVDESLDRLRSCLVRVANSLSDGRRYLLGDLYSIADIVLTPSVVRMSDLGLSSLWAGLPAIETWFDRITSRPSFAAAYVEGSRVDPATYRLSQGNQVRPDA